MKCPQTVTLGMSHSSLLISSTQDLKHRPIRGSEVIPTRLACPLNGADEFDPCRFHRGSCRIDIIHLEGDHRASGEKRVKFLIGAIEFHLRIIGQLESRKLRFVSNGLHTHYITKELHHLFKLRGSQSQPDQSFDMLRIKL